MLLRQLFDSETWTYTYLVADELSGQAALIDPVLNQVDRDLKLVEELGLTLRYALDTHVHADHVTGAGQLRHRSGCAIVTGELGPESADMRLAHGAELELGSLRIELIATPGHTDDSVSFRVGSEVFTGDTLFVRGTGRTDFQNGDAATLYRSVVERLFTLPEDTRVWPGHDYRGQTVSRIGEEKNFNPRLAGRSLEDFVAIMEGLDLPDPRFIHEAVPANREVGLGVAEGRTEREVQEISAADFDALPQGVRIIDVREPHELVGEFGSLPGSENVPMGTFPAAAQDWEKSTPLVCVCRSGRRSRQVCDLLVQLGFEDVSNLHGGLQDYRGRGANAA